MMSNSINPSKLPEIWLRNSHLGRRKLDIKYQSLISLSNIVGIERLEHPIATRHFVAMILLEVTVRDIIDQISNDQIRQKMVYWDTGEANISIAPDYRSKDLHVDSEKLVFWKI